MADAQLPHEVRGESGISIHRHEVTQKDSYPAGVVETLIGQRALDEQLTRGVRDTESIDQWRGGRVPPATSQPRLS